MDRVSVYGTEDPGSTPGGGTIGGSSDSADDLLSYVRARIAISSRLEVGPDQPGAFLAPSSNG